MQKTPISFQKPEYHLVGIPKVADAKTPKHVHSYKKPEKTNQLYQKYMITTKYTKKISFDQNFERHCVALHSNLIRTH